MWSQVEGPRSPNTEGEDELLRRGLDTVATGAPFVALIDDIDFRAASLVTLPRLLFVDDVVARVHPGQLFWGKVDRSVAASMEYYSMNELVAGVASNAQLVAAIPAGPLAGTLRSEAVSRRLRCAYVAAVMVLLGGDTTPGIHCMNEELGLKLAVAHAPYVCAAGSLVAARLHSAPRCMDWIVRLWCASIPSGTSTGAPQI